MTPASHPVQPGHAAASLNSPGVDANPHRGAFRSQNKLAAMKIANAARRQPVAALGWSWPSQSKAAEAMGIHHTGVVSALKRGTFEALVMRRLGAKW